MDASLNFIGQISASKSLFNRALIAQSFFPELYIHGQSFADDVVRMKAALKDFPKSGEFDCGEAGTVLRFLALRCSRKPGEYVLKGSPRLFERPQNELKRVLEQLGVSVDFFPSQMVIKSKGWFLSGDTLIVPSERSSQFVSSVALAAWDLPFDLYVSPERLSNSESYFRMTVRLLESLGMQFQFWDRDFRISKNQKIKTQEVQIEPDMSSAFAVAAAAAVSGTAHLLHFPEQSLQPDFIFLSILRSMGAPTELSAKGLRVSRAQELKGVSVDLKNAPDLFPVLAVLCAFASSPSELKGAPQLVYKESNRLNKTRELLEKVGCGVEQKPDGVVIRPTKSLKGDFDFDPDSDHRLAMACGILMASGLDIRLHSPEVVNKSFPEFWNSIGVVP